MELLFACLICFSPVWGLGGLVFALLLGFLNQTSVSVRCVFQWDNDDELTMMMMRVRTR